MAAYATQQFIFGYRKSPRRLDCPGYFFFIFKYNLKTFFLLNLIFILYLKINYWQSFDAHGFIYKKK